jgi:hypothetical protein
MEEDRGKPRSGMSGLRHNEMAWSPGGRSLAYTDAGALFECDVGYGKSRGIGTGVGEVKVS